MRKQVQELVSLSLEYSDYKTRNMTKESVQPSRTYLGNLVKSRSMEYNCMHIAK